MFKSAVEWVVWSIVGVVLIALFVLHYSNVIFLPDYLLLLDAFCLGMFTLLFFGAIAQVMKRR
jgi:hypothetical protein